MLQHERQVPPMAALHGQAASRSERRRRVFHHGRVTSGRATEWQLFALQRNKSSADPPDEGPECDMRAEDQM